MVLRLTAREIEDRLQRIVEEEIGRTNTPMNTHYSGKYYLRIMGRAVGPSFPQGWSKGGKTSWLAKSCPLMKA